MDTSDQPVVGEFDVDAIGDIGAYEPDGGVGISTSPDGSFVIARIAEMGWTIKFSKPSNRQVIGCTRAEVRGGETTRLRVTVFP